MKRGSFVGKRQPINKVSAKVKRERTEFDAVYRDVDERSGGRCEVVLPWAIGARAFETRCPARAVEHHHTRTPRRSFHAPEWVLHICRRHHDMTTAAYRTGRLLIEPSIQPDGTSDFLCRVVTKESKFA